MSAAHRLRVTRGHWTAFPVTVLLAGAACNATTASAEPPPVTASLCTTPTRTSGVLLGANVNALFWEAHYRDERLLAAVRSLGQPVVRLPGGTESDYFDWEQGRPVDACRYDGCRSWDNAQLTPPGLFQRFGAFQNGTASAFVALARDVNGTLMLVTNTVTASVDDNVRWVNAAVAAGGPVPFIELSNEPYFGQVEGTDNTQRLYPTAASHVAFVRPLATALRARVPSARLAFPLFVPRVDVATGLPSPGHDARMLTWNEQSLATGIANDVDAFALHFYPRLPGRRGATDTEYLRTLATFAPSYWDATLRQPQWALLPSDKRLWVTELNASFADAPELIGTWMHGLIHAQLVLRMLQDPRIDVALQHMLTGNPQWQSVVHPGRTPDITPAPGFAPYALTASGESMAALSTGVRGATCVQELPRAALPGATAGVVGVIARDATGARAVIVNATADTITVDWRALGFTDVTAVQHRTAPLSRPGAGAAVEVTPLSAASDQRTVRVAPYALAIIR
jgi:hypothetical protein